MHVFSFLRRLNTTLLIGLVLISSFFVSVTPASASAQTDFGIQSVEDQGLGLASTPLDSIVVRSINIILGFLGLIAVVIVLYGGFVYMTAAGNEDRVAQAKMILRNGLIGLTIVLFSWGITKFVISRLSDASGGTILESDDGGLGGCHGIQCGEYPGCYENNFAAQSITPSQDQTGMNNVVVRAVFTQTIGSLANQVISIRREGVDITNQFSFSFAPGSKNHVVEGVYNGQNSSCVNDGSNNTHCIPSDGTYTVEIRNDVVSESGQSLETANVCGFTPVQQVTFTVDIATNDDTDPSITSLGVVNPSTGNIYTENMPYIVSGREYRFAGRMTDNSGSGYVHLHIAADDDASDVFDAYTGPGKNTSGDPFSFGIDQFISNSIVRQWNAPKKYTITATAFDIDHNSTQRSASFVLIGPHCTNGVMDSSLGETDIDIGGSCGGTGSCTQNYQCATGSCVDGQCVAKPQITSVDPMDGAPGNWVTIRGYYFGNTVGTIEFGSDETGWINAPVVSCATTLRGQSWQNTYIIAEVPDPSAFSRTVSTAAIRVTNRESGESDTTIDSFGPMPSYVDTDGTVHEDGLFRFTTTKRPGLCSVVTNGAQGAIPDGVAAAPPGTAIRAEGKGFGTAQSSGDVLEFVVNPPQIGTIASWQDTKIVSQVPGTLSNGSPLVRIKRGGEYSNGIPFTITDSALANAKPFISSLSPTDPTPGSYLTITGYNFGQAGVVYLASSPTASCVFNSQDDGCVELTAPPAPCQNTWTNTQIIVDVPSTILDTNPGQYIIVERADNRLRSDGSDDRISIQNGAPKPSICKLDPTSGPAPLPSSHPGLSFYGKNFTTNPTLYFWNGAGDISNPADVQNLTGANSPWIASNESSTSGTTIRARIPYRAASDHPTMPQGQWPIAISAGGVEGNSINYFVTDCRLESSAPASGLKCCEDGADAGSWKTLCEGDAPSSGYVWRFTTGQLPRQPQVLVQCNAAEWGSGEFQNPSPVPSTEWRDSGNMCQNATVQVVLNTAIDPATLDNTSVQMYKCGSTSGAITCDYEDQDRVLFDTNDLQIEDRDTETVLIIKQPSSLNERHLDANTWYRVLLTTNIHAPAVGSTALPLLATRPLSGAGAPDDVAFYYDFQTGTGLCSLSSVWIDPSEKTVYQLGPIMKSLQSDIPFYYYLRGVSSRACTVLNINGLGWRWQSDDTSKATIAPSVAPGYADTRATAEALVHTPLGVDFSAHAEGASLGTPFEHTQSATSTLYISIGEPKVVSYEPNCAASCPNAVIKATFNRQMDPRTYRGGTHIFQCTDPNCLETTELDLAQFTINESFDTTNASASTNMFSLTITPNSGVALAAGAYFKVVLDDHIQSLARRSGAWVNDGQSLTPFTWVFRTKNDGALCGIARVGVVPHPFVATYVGQKTKFTVAAFGSPNECSPTGQQLSLSESSVVWNSTDPRVAAISTFRSTGVSSAVCSAATCLPKGSTVSYIPNQPIAGLCGNGTVDAGEDCDIAAPGEVAGNTCTLACLRPGNTTAQCGNGEVSGVDGEACDPASSGSGALYCTNSCLKTGSSPQFNPRISGYCGDGLVGVEEACDIGISLASTLANGSSPSLSQVGCSQSCLHTGTPLSLAWCAAHPNVGDAIKQACLGAKSVCGNGITEPGEECEVTESGSLPANCSTQCLYKSLCDVEGSISSRCTPGTEGCNSATCRLSGSSLFYSTPSMCGDGVVGIGELLACEGPAPSAGVTQYSSQIATAIGEGTDVTVGQKTVQETTIQSTVDAVVGTAAYTLQCGFEEYDAPVGEEYNNCIVPNGMDPNSLGVATNSCCYPRPVRNTEYPAENAGFGSEEPMCRNSYISVTFDEPVLPSSISGNALLVHGYEGVVNCTDLGGQDVTSEMNAALNIGSGTADASNGGFWSDLWNGIKHLVRRFVQFVFAQDASLANIQTWCSEGTLRTENTSVTSTVPLYLPKAMGSDTAESVYGVLLRGGNTGIRDAKGVGIKNTTSALTSDAWAFVVSTQICKISSVSVAPDSAIFTTPNTSTIFIADAKTDRGQLIVPTPAYNWRWEWQPQASTIFAIPADGASAINRQTKMGSTNVEGSVTAVAQAVVTADVSTQSNQVGKTFEGTVLLTSDFCERPWPARNGSEWSPYTDDQYHYSFSYCADAGQGGVTSDDLPYFAVQSVAISQNDPAGTLKKLLLVSETNTDAVGVQIFENPGRLSARDWFIDRFPNAAPPQQIELVGYDAVANQNNYYVNALNVVKNANGDVTNVYNNIYLFSISDAAQAGTRDAFNEILDTLTFNTNLTDHKYCISGDGETADFTNSCTTDFDCTIGLKQETVQSATTGLCQPSTPVGASDLWTLSSPVTDEFRRHKLSDINAASASVAWARGEDMHIVKTVDGGATWSNAYAQSISNASALDDESQSYYRQLIESPRDNITHDLAAVSATEAYIIASDTNENHRLVLKYENGTWQIVWQQSSNQTPFPQNFVPQKIVMNSAGEGYLFGTRPVKNDTDFVVSERPLPEYAWVYRTTNHGQSWTGSRVSAISTIVHDATFTPEGSVIAVGDDGMVYRSPADARGTWIAYPLSGGEDLMSVSFERTTGWVGGSAGTVYVGFKDGRYWKRNSVAVSSGTIKDIGLASPTEAWTVTDSGSFHTTDGGDSWQSYTITTQGVPLISVSFVNGQGFSIKSKHGDVYKTQQPAQSTPELLCSSSADCSAGYSCVGNTAADVISYRSDGCHEEKTKLLRDWERLQDVRTIQSTLNTASYPELNEGTFRPNYVASVWPSWGSFGTLVGKNLPQDPVNVWAGCDPADPTTCWDADNSSFICPQNASVYEYKYEKEQAGYSLHVPFEFFKSESQIESLFGAFVLDPVSFTIARECIPEQVYSVTQSQCGDGVVGPGEECDPAGSTGISLCGGAGSGSYQTWSCSNTCQITNVGQCTNNISCGNGRVEGNEKCDDGSAFNGQYGQCNTSCSGLAPAYCGNSIKESAYEFCDPTESGFGLYSLDKEHSCSWDCRAYGSYCGDGVINSTNGETCDDGNTTNGDGCSAACKIEGMCNYNGAVTQSCTGDNTCPLTYFASKKAAVAPTTSVCMYNETDPIYSPIDGFSEYVQVYPCSSSVACQTGEAYGYDDTAIYSDNPDFPSATVSGDDFALDSRSNNIECISIQEANNFDNGGTVSCIPNTTQSTPSSGTAGSNGAPTTTTAGPACGNGVIDPNEQCDPAKPGTNLASNCTNLGYGASCTYCTNQCKVQSVDSTLYCGNGQIDVRDTGTYESCDARPDGSVVVRLANGQTEVRSCDGYEHGTVSCSNSCSTLSSSCFNCGESPSGALAQVSFVNPMIGGTVQSPYLDKPFVILLNRMINGSEENIGELWPSDQSTNFVGAMQNLPFRENRKIATQNVCSANCANGVCSSDGYYLTFVSNQGPTGTEAKFSYQVADQQTTVTNEYLTVPKAPVGSIRVVIRWGATEKNAGAHMRGYLYSLGFYYTIEYPGHPTVVTDARTRVGYSDAINNLCTQAQAQYNGTVLENYIPTACPAFKQGIFVHPETGLTNIFTQATTLQLDTLRNDGDEPIAFIVRNETGAIEPWKNKNIQVEVYTNEAGDTNIIQPPTFTYTIRTAANTSSNTVAPWWHVFNLIPDGQLLESETTATSIRGTGYSIVPVESIETSECGVKNNMYTTQDDCSEV